MKQPINMGVRDTAPSDIQLVYEALDNAVANGHEMSVMPVNEIVDDLIDCDADVVDIPRDRIARAVSSWLRRS